MEPEFDSIPSTIPVLNPAADEDPAHPACSGVNNRGGQMYNTVEENGNCKVRTCILDSRVHSLRRLDLLDEGEQ
jgi:hypothetical protein